MTRNRSFKKAVRAQMERSGQSYMQAHNVVRTETPLINPDTIPQWADYPLDDNLPWNVFPLGLGENNTLITWDITTAAHGWIAGQTGTGKSVVQRNIVLHCLRHPEHWDFHGVDFKRAEMAEYKHINPQVIKSVDHTLQEALMTLTLLSEEMQRRYQLLAEADSSIMSEHSTLNNKNIMLMIDELGWLLPSAHDPRDTPEDQEVAEIRQAIKMHLGGLIRLGRAAGIHVVLATQIIGGSVLNAELYANMSMRYVLRNHPRNYHALLGKDLSDVLDPARAGMAVLSINDHLRGVQTFYSSPTALQQHQG